MSKWESKLVQPLWKIVWRFLKKLKIELPYDPAIALLGIYPTDTDVLKRRAVCIPVFIAAMATIAKVWKEPRCPSTDEWIMKIWSRWPFFSLHLYSWVKCPAVQLLGHRVVLFLIF